MREQSPDLRRGWSRNGVKPKIVAALKTLGLVKKEPFLGTYQMNVKSDVCKTTVDLRAGILDEPGGRGKIELREARDQCPDQLARAQLLDLFRTAVIDRVNALLQTRPP